MNLISQLRKDKRGYTLGDLQGIVLTLVVVAVLFGAGLYTLTKFRDKIGASTTAQYMAVENVSQGIGDLASWIPIIAIVIAAALIIGIVVRSFQAPMAS